jgi:hypothetical protein
MSEKDDSIKKDPLADSPEPERIYYATGAMLDQEDFLCEQSYHRGRLARLAAYLHGSGTVAGLAVTVAAGEEAKLRVTPGLAIDRLGRLVELRRPYCIRLAKWYDRQGAGLHAAIRAADAETSFDHLAVDLFIEFTACERGRQPAFAGGNFDTLNGTAPARLRDSARLSLVVRSETALPLPVSGFPDLSSLNEAERRAAISRYKLEDAWQEGTLWKEDGTGLNHGPEHTTFQNGTEILLARLLVPVVAAAGQPPEMDGNREIVVMNEIRRFVFSGAELDWLTEAYR